MKHCTVETCGKKLHDETKKVYDEQMEAKKRAREEQKAKKETAKKAKKAQAQELKAKGNKREARKLRAEAIGFQYEDGELDSDQDPDGCEEFDGASDSSLVPPWAGDDGDY
jgi:hypothetical protein